MKRTERKGFLIEIGSETTRLGVLGDNQPKKVLQTPQWIFKNSRKYECVRLLLPLRINYSSHSSYCQAFRPQWKVKMTSKRASCSTQRAAQMKKSFMSLSRKSSLRRYSLFSCHGGLLGEKALPNRSKGPSCLLSRKPFLSSGVPRASCRNHSQQVPCTFVLLGFIPPKVSKVGIAYTNITSLYLTGATSGIIIDLGKFETRVSPICESFELKRNNFFTPASLHVVKRRLLKNMIEFDGFSAASEPMGPTFDLILKQKLSFLSREETSAILNTEEKKKKALESLLSFKILHKQFNFHNVSFYSMVEATNGLFHIEDQEKNISYVFLQAVNSIPFEIRKKVLQNIVFVGGGSSIRGLIRRFRDDVSYFLENEKEFQELQRLKSFMAVSEPSYTPAIAPWVGASLHALLVQEKGGVGIKLKSKEEPKA